MTKFAALVLALSTVTLACAGTPDDSKSPTAKSEGELQMQQTDTKVAGTWTLGSDKVVFESVAIGDEVFEVDLKVHGLVLDATIDFKNHTSSLDGFAAENGGDTQLLEEDHVVLDKFVKSLEVLGGEPSAHAMLLRRVASVWSQTGSAMELERRVMGEEGRGYSSLCYAIGSVRNSSHDCWSGGWWGSKTSVYSYVGYWTSSTYYWRGYWSTDDYDHGNWPTEYGQCYGRCGGGCGSDQDYTQDCHNHDNCVRNGHWVTSSWCSDELASATDDEMYAPNCGRS